MKTIILAVLLVAVLALAGCTQQGTAPTPTPAPLGTATPTPSTLIEEITITPTPTPLATATPAATPTLAPTPTPVPTLNSVYTASIAPITLDSDLFPGDARDVFRYEDGKIYLPANLTYGDYAPNLGNYYVLQFNSAPYQPRIQQLQDLQVKFSWPVNQNAFIIYCSPVTYTQAANYRDVNFTIKYHPAFKIAKQLFYANGTTRVKASFFRGENENATTTAITSFGGNIQSLTKMDVFTDAPGGEGSAIFWIDAANIPLVANLTAVHWIEPA